MPYGIKKDVGGDSPENVSWMERCVSHISGTNKRTGKPYTKGEKIAICKAQLDKKKTSNSEVEEEVLRETEAKLFLYKSRLMKDKLLTYAQAESYLERILAETNYNLP